MTVSKVCRIAVLASGGGSNLQAIIDYFATLGDRACGSVVLVASDRPDAGALDRARTHEIPGATLSDPADGPALCELLEKHRVDLVALAGYLRLLPPRAVAAYRHRILNIHPAPLPEFGGRGMYGRRVHEAVIAAGASSSAVTVHFVDEEYDRGAVIARWPVPVRGDDTPDSLAKRVLSVEHLVYPRILDMVAAMTLPHTPRI
jgi:phosphoribosylglycinamide formyltransferase-1